MKKLLRSLAAAGLTAVLLVASAGVAAADPGQNEILVNAQCENGAKYTFVIKGEGDVGHVVGSNDRVVIKRYTVTYYDADSGAFIGTQTVDSGQKTGLDVRLISCTGTTSFNHWQLGDVYATFDFEAVI